MKANPLRALFRVRCFPQTRLRRAVARALAATLTAIALSAGVSARADGVVTDCSETGLHNALSSGGTVTFSGSCSITLSQPIVIDGTVTIDAGPYTVTLSGGNAVSLFLVNGSLTLKSLTVSGGFASSGGAMSISPGASVLVTNCVFAGNTAAGTNGTPGVNGSNSGFAVGGDGSAGTSGTPGLGGAIYNSGTLTLCNSTFVTNNATAGSGAAGGNGGSSGGSLGQGGNGGSGGGGGSAWGGAVYNAGTLTAINSTFTGNGASAGNGAAGGSGGSAAFPGRAGNGGAGGAASGAGIYNASSLVVRACTFSGNTCFGGNSAAGGTKSNGSGNSGPNGGDALGAGLATAQSSLITNCTFFDNMTIGGSGGNGGPANGSVSQGGNGGSGGSGVGASIYVAAGGCTNVNCTIANGSAVGGTNGVAGSGPFPGNDGQPGQTLGAGIGSGGVVLLLNSLLSTNTLGGNGYGTIIDGGYNLSSDASIPLGPTSFTSTDPQLGTLTNNGGPTLTMALLTTNSPAYGAIPTNIITFPPTDQRGVVRPQGAKADIGAFELATAPAIITPPQSQSQSFGGSVTLTVDATGGSLRYQWQFNGANIVGALSSSYTLSNIAITNAGNYQVVITNSYGSVTSSNATLTVVPYLVAGLTNQEVLIDNSATFSANATGSQPLNYQWYFNSTNVVVGATAANLTISNAQLSDAGAYSVVITNVGGSVTSAPATLLVDAITVQPASQTVPSGTRVNFSVVATGTSLNYTWFFNGTQLPGVSSASFSITATTNTAGTYRVNVGNTLVTMVSDPAVLTVVVPSPTTISHTSVTSNQFNLVYQTQPSLRYVLQSKNSLLDSVWMPLQTNIGTGGMMTSSDWTTNQPNRFYRLLIQ